MRRTSPGLSTLRSDRLRSIRKSIPRVPAQSRIAPPCASGSRAVQEFWLG